MNAPHMHSSRRRRIGTASAIAAAALVCAGCAGPTPSYVSLAERYANQESQWLTLGDLRVHYRDEGPRQAPTLVLVHGFAASLHAWEPWVQRLKRDYRIISLDLPGHGLTESKAGYRVSPSRQVQVIDDLTRALGVDRFVIAGNSMGGAVAWRYTLANPDKVRGLVLVDAAGWPREGAAAGRPGGWLLRNPLSRAVMKSINIRPIAERGLKLAYLDPSLTTPALIDRYVSLLSAPGHKDVLLTQEVEDQNVTPQEFQRIQAPTLVMTGEQDEIVPPADAKAFAAHIPGARLISYPGVGHLPMEQIPDRSAEDLRAFLTTLPP